MNERDQVALRAAAALATRHRAGLGAGEQVDVRFSHARDAHRVELRLHDPEADTLLELFADVPQDAVEDEEAAIALGLDFLDGVLAEVLASGREAFARLLPEPYAYEGLTIYLSGDSRRPELEAAADALLAHGAARSR